MEPALGGKGHLEADRGAPLEHRALELVPSTGAVFKGSFAADRRKEEKRIRAELGLWSATYHFFTDGWDDVSVWKSAFIELAATMSLCYLSAIIGITIVNFQTAQLPAYVGITNVFLLMLFIYATAPASGGHLNPLITFATMTTGLTEFPRAILYILGQTIGGAIAGGLIRGSFGSAMTEKYHGGGCFLDPNSISPGQAFLIEMMSSFILTFVAFGVGLDPRQAELFGPVIGPCLVGCTLGLASFASAGLIPGFAGAGMNPARCFAFAVARGNFRDQWIWWVGPLAGTVMQTFCYRTVPPYHSRELIDEASNGAH